MQPETPTAKVLVARLGGHPASRLGLDLDKNTDTDSETGLGGWLIASVLFGGRVPETAAEDAFRRLRDAGLATPKAVAAAGAAALVPYIEQASLPKPEAVAAVIARVCEGLVRAHGGSVERLAAGADGLEDLASGLARLGRGFGRAAVLRFLTPLRDRWSALNDLPATPAVASAAFHLGLVSDPGDFEAVPARVAAFVRNETERDGVDPEGPTARDVEAALDRLGRRACLRERTDRCLLAEDCPRRRGAGPKGVDRE